MLRANFPTFLDEGIFFSLIEETNQKKKTLGEQIANINQLKSMEERISAIDQKFLLNSINDEIASLILLSTNLPPTQNEMDLQKLQQMLQIEPAAPSEEQNAKALLKGYQESVNDLKRNLEACRIDNTMDISKIYFSILLKTKYLSILLDTVLNKSIAYRDFKIAATALNRHSEFSNGMLPGLLTQPSMTNQFIYIANETLNDTEDTEDTSDVHHAREMIFKILLKRINHSISCDQHLDTLLHKFNQLGYHQPNANTFPQQTQLQYGRQFPPAPPQQQPFSSYQPDSLINRRFGKSE